jgi:hypothetical protein
MNAEEILATLEKLGKPQTGAIYRRHGSGDNVFGVLTSEIARLQKIKVDHALAMELWKTGNAVGPFLRGPRTLRLSAAPPLDQPAAFGAVKKRGSEAGKLKVGPSIRMDALLNHAVSFSMGGIMAHNDLEGNVIGEIWRGQNASTERSFSEFKETTTGSESTTPVTSCSSALISLHSV